MKGTIYTYPKSTACNVTIVAVTVGMRTLRREVPSTFVDAHHEEVDIDSPVGQRLLRDAQNCRGTAWYE
jgi:hypothetical protein